MKKILFFGLVTIFLISCSKSDSSNGRQTVIDTVVIGGQTWMKYNLDVDKYRNGDLIPQVQDPSLWDNLTTGAWCYYQSNTENGRTYGKLYNWYAVNDPRGLAPEGWSIPTVDQWISLETNLGGMSVAGGKMKLPGTTLWVAPNTDATNSSGFTGLPGGIRYPNNSYLYIGKAGYWWSSTAPGVSHAWVRALSNTSAELARLQILKVVGLSVRCIRN
jgi:uncharacterized protein (TIGR02145 family)